MSNAPSESAMVNGTQSSSDVRLDLYFEWAKATEYVDLGGRPERLPVIIEFEKVHTPHELSKADESVIEIHPLYKNAQGPLDRSRYCTGRVSDAFFERVDAGKGLGDSPDKLKVSRFELALPPFDAVERRHQRIVVVDQAIPDFQHHLVQV